MTKLEILKAKAEIANCKRLAKAMETDAVRVSLLQRAETLQKKIDEAEKAHEANTSDVQPAA